ncbi:hypothetical protein PV08_02308 [Exophiala spinifera]|uniref:Major facilitator superfamily (MFS) profile domain-containing protein n=1 Tax=Exophiala spinifera TaxID=91928 RepID=A0A0D1YS37_9EURO|nr:uncharacterized protein PV08_02308 [Exophiala spinifera]KIW18021.1 hypothetical protein PV08_02308 [Exophiala spinifera]
MSSFNYGFDVQAMAAAQAMNSFDAQFGIYAKKTHKWKLQPYFLSLLNSCHAPAQIAGVYVGSVISNRYGRRMCVFVMSIYALFSSAIIFSSHTKAQILAGRTIHYCYLGMELAVVPTTLAELSPPRFRSSMVGLYWLSIKLGGLIISVIANRTSQVNTNWAWRIPFSLFFIVPTIVASLIWFLPESPRWLVLRDRHDEAAKSLRRLRKPETSDAQLMAELDELETAVAQQPHKGKFMEVFRGTHLRRTMIACMVNFFQQASGQSFSSQYGTLFVKGLGGVDPFTINMVNNAMNVIGIVICLLLSDRFGRRPMIHISGVLQVGALLTMGALGVHAHPRLSERRGIVAMLLVFSFGYSVGWAPLTYLIAAEVPSPQLREHTLRLAYTIKLVTEWTVSFTYPYLEDDQYAGLGSKLGFIYGSFAALAVICGYFFVPETRDLALEEIDWQFSNDVPTRKIRSIN